MFYYLITNVKLHGNHASITQSSYLAEFQILWENNLISILNYFKLILESLGVVEDARPKLVLSEVPFSGASLCKKYDIYLYDIDSQDILTIKESRNLIEWEYILIYRH